MKISFFLAAFIFGSGLFNFALGQSLEQVKPDSVANTIKPTEYIVERVITPCRIGSQLQYLQAQIDTRPYDATLYPTGYRNQKLLVISNRNFRNRERGYQRY